MCRVSGWRIEFPSVLKSFVQPTSPLPKDRSDCGLSLKSRDPKGKSRDLKWKYYDSKVKPPCDPKLESRDSKLKSHDPRLKSRDPR